MVKTGDAQFEWHLHHNIPFYFKYLSASKDLQIRNLEMNLTYHKEEVFTLTFLSKKKMSKSQKSYKCNLGFKQVVRTV